MILCKSSSIILEFSIWLAFLPLILAGSGWDNCLNNCVLGPLIGEYGYGGCDRFDFDCVCSFSDFQHAVRDCTSTLCAASSSSISAFTSSLCHQAQSAGQAATAYVTVTKAASVYVTVTEAASVYVTVTKSTSISAPIATSVATVTIQGANQNNDITHTVTMTLTSTSTATAHCASSLAAPTAPVTTITETLTNFKSSTDITTYTRTITSAATTTSTITTTVRDDANSATIGASKSTLLCPAGVSTSTATGIGVASALGGMALLSLLGAAFLLKKRRDRHRRRSEPIYLSGKVHDENYPEPPEGPQENTAPVPPVLPLGLGHNRRQDTIPRRPVAGQQGFTAVPSTVGGEAYGSTRPQSYGSSHGGLVPASTRSQSRIEEEQEQLLRQQGDRRFAAAQGDWTVARTDGPYEQYSHAAQNRPPELPTYGGYWAENGQSYPR